MKKIYPYLVTDDYPIDIESGKSIPLGYNVYIEWVISKKNTVESYNISKDKNPEKTKQIAEQNLIDAFKNDIKAMRFDDGPNGQPFILIGNHWTAASQILNPNLFSWASKNLNSQKLLISIPHRDALLIFPYCDSEQQKNIIDMVIAKESDGAKMLTFKLYVFDETGINAIP